jgi:hypothetical protein
MTSNLPPEMQALLGANLKSVGQPSAAAPPARRDDLQRQWAEKLDRARQVDQSRMPAWDGARLIASAPTSAAERYRRRQYDQAPKPMPEWRDPRTP